MTNSRKSLAKAFASAISLFVSFVVLSLAVGEGVTEAFDSLVRITIHGTNSPALTALMELATRLGSGSLLTLLFMACFLYLYFVGSRRSVWMLAIIMAAAVVLENGLKFLVHRARPDPFFSLVAPETFSFPSGHTLFSTCFYGMAAWILSERLSDNLSRAAVWTSAATIVMVVGFSRVYLGVHYPTDVLGGFLAGASLLCVVRVGKAYYLNGAPFV